jgi:hypothetical protein
MKKLIELEYMVILIIKILGALWPSEYGGTPPEDFDSFHDLIYVIIKLIIA